MDHYSSYSEEGDTTGVRGLFMPGKMAEFELADNESVVSVN